MDWVRLNMYHGPGGNALANEQGWGYRGYPPVKTMIEGHEFMGRVQHLTGGCWGAAGFLLSVLRNLNIPFKVVECNHGQGHFVTEGRYLDHGDSLYHPLNRDDPSSYPQAELLIDEATYAAWFPSTADCSNVGRRIIELAKQYLPLYLLRLYCNDQAAGKTHANGEVAALLSSVYTVAELEADNLWGRMDAKIALLGGCDNIPLFG